MPGWSRWEALFADPKVWHFAFHMKADLPKRLLYGREYDYVSTFIFDRAFDRGAHAIADVELFARAFAQPGRTRGGLEWYRAFRKDHASALIWKREPLAMPVLGLGGDRRWGSEIVAMLEEFADDVRGGSVADCDHWLAEERPTETANALLTFLAQYIPFDGVLRCDLRRHVDAGWQLKQSNFSLQRRGLGVRCLPLSR
jgi:pimeloyl-ACP methyl ester carboxylesterase